MFLSYIPQTLFFSILQLVQPVSLHDYNCPAFEGIWKLYKPTMPVRHHLPARAVHSQEQPVHAANMSHTHLGFRVLQTETPPTPVPNKIWPNLQIRHSILASCALLNAPIDACQTPGRSDWA